MGRKLEKFCPLRVFHTGAKSKFTQITDFNFRLCSSKLQIKSYCDPNSSDGQKINVAPVCIAES